MIFVDTNVFVRFLTWDDPVPAKRVAALFEKAARGEAVLKTSHVVIAELAWVLCGRYKLSRAEAAELIKTIAVASFLHIDERAAIIGACCLFERHNIDFVDCYHAALMQAHGEHELFSYDTDFDRIAGIARKEP